MYLFTIYTYILGTFLTYDYDFDKYLLFGERQKGKRERKKEKEERETEREERQRYSFPKTVMTLSIMKF